MYMEIQRAKNNQDSLEEEQKVVELKTNYKTTVIKTVQHWNKERDIDNGTELNIQK